MSQVQGFLDILGIAAAKNACAGESDFSGFKYKCPVKIRGYLYWRLMSKNSRRYWSSAYFQMNGGRAVIGLRTRGPS